MRYSYYGAIPTNSRYVIMCDSNAIYKTARQHSNTALPADILNKSIFSAPSGRASNAYAWLRRVDYYAL